MPLNVKTDQNRVSSKVYTLNHEPESKKILIELTSVLIVALFIVFRTVLCIWPGDVWLESIPTLVEIQGLLQTVASQLAGTSLLPGAFISFFTWHLMYFDSAVPGVNPPTPLSPSKYRAMSGADFHLNFLFAMAIGPVVTTLMYFEYA